MRLCECGCGGVTTIATQNEYRLVMAEKLGRYLGANEHVHHVDLDYTNNDPDNLVLVTRSQHMRIHRLIDRGGMDPRAALNVAVGAG